MALLPASVYLATNTSWVAPALTPFRGVPPNCTALALALVLVMEPVTNTPVPLTARPLAWSAPVPPPAVAQAQAAAAGFHLATNTSWSPALVSTVAPKPTCPEKLPVTNTSPAAFTAVARTVDAPAPCGLLASCQAPVAGSRLARAAALAGSGP